MKNRPIERGRGGGAASGAANKATERQTFSGEQAQSEGPAEQPLRPARNIWHGAISPAD